MFYICECLLTHDPTNQGSQSSGFSRTYVRLSENLKTGDSKESFLLEKDFETCYSVTFPKKTIQILDAQKPTKDMKFKLFFTCSSTYELSIVSKLSYYTVRFPKNIQILEAWKPTKNMNLRLESFFTSPSTYELIQFKSCFGHLQEHLQSATNFEGKSKRKSAKNAKKLNSQKGM